MIMRKSNWLKRAWLTRTWLKRTWLKRAPLAALLVSLCGAAPSARAAPGPDCTTEAAALTRAQSELPRLDVASPADRPPYCITLETIMGFAGRVKAHVAHCPSSDYATAVAEWDKTRTDYSKLFGQYRCKRTL
jgi:hypothetical protein